MISVDTKKKELVGDFKNAGREWRPKRDFEDVRVHDFLIRSWGALFPTASTTSPPTRAFVGVGVDNDTAAFAVQTLRGWWTEVGSIKYPNAKRLVITADGGGSNGSRARLWKLELQRLADELGLDTEVHHFLPGTSKWNKACPREGGDRASPVLVRHDEWRARPLVSHQVIVELISSTTTETGLKVLCELDPNPYPKGVAVTDDRDHTATLPAALGFRNVRYLTAGLIVSGISKNMFAGFSMSNIRRLCRCRSHFLWSWVGVAVLGDRAQSP